MFHVKHDKKISEYKKLLKKYHSSLDLISKKALENIDDKISDALQYAQSIEDLELENNNILDIGSGNGLPAIIMAIALPHWNFSLVERRSRRASFLKIVVSQLGLQNVRVHNTDVKLLRLEPHAVITAQAVADFTDLYCLSSHLHSSKISLLSRKGQGWRAEIEGLEKRLKTKIDVQEPIRLSGHGNLISLRVLGGMACQ